MPHLGSQPPSISTAAEDCGAWPAQVPVCDGGGEIQAAFAPVPVIDAINARLREYAEAQERVTYVDCNAVLLEVGGGGEVRVF